MIPFFSSAVGNIITVKVRRRQAIDRRWRLRGIYDVAEHCRYGSYARAAENVAFDNLERVVDHDALRPAA